jgi:hypothetical protein
MPLEGKRETDETIWVWAANETLKLEIFVFPHSWVKPCLTLAKGNLAAWNQPVFHLEVLLPMAFWWLQHPVQSIVLTALNPNGEWQLEPRFAFCDIIAHPIASRLEKLLLF